MSEIHTASSRLPDVTKEFPELRSEVRHTAQIITNVIETTPWSFGKSPKGIAASSVYLADLLYNPDDHLSQTDFSNRDIISDVTIRKRYRELPRLFLENADNEDIEELGDEYDQTFVLKTLDYFEERNKDVKPLDSGDWRPDVHKKDEEFLKKYKDSTKALDQSNKSDQRAASAELKENGETTFKESPKESPELMEDPEYIERKCRKRSSTFQRRVRDAYNERCAVCGKGRQSPDGIPEVEVAHIFPKSKDGNDNVQNGLALCKLHHWAFDNGWLSVTNNHEIMVRDKPGIEGYEDFAEFDGEPLHLPENDEHQPHPIFLREHRKLHGLEAH